MPQPPDGIGAQGCGLADDPPILAEKVEYCCSSSAPPQVGQATTAAPRTSFSNWLPQPSQRYS